VALAANWTDAPQWYRPLVRIWSREVLVEVSWMAPFGSLSNRSLFRVRIVGVVLAMERLLLL
jgi:hypothetical protein